MIGKAGAPLCGLRSPRALDGGWTLDRLGRMVLGLPVSVLRAPGRVCSVRAFCRAKAFLRRSTSFFAEMVCAWIRRALLKASWKAAWSNSGSSVIVGFCLFKRSSFSLKAWTFTNFT